MTTSALVLGAAAGNQAAAQVLAETAGVKAGDIIVTARRVEERLQDVPISMTLYNEQQISNRNIVIASDLAIVHAVPFGEPALRPGKVLIRHPRVQPGDQHGAKTVGVYFAEVVGLRALGGTTSGNTVGAGAFMDLQNVQVLKGPQGTLFGRNTTGGAVLLTRRKPTTSSRGLSSDQPATTTFGACRAR